MQNAILSKLICTIARGDLADECSTMPGAWEKEDAAVRRSKAVERRFFKLQHRL